MSGKGFILSDELARQLGKPPYRLVSRIEKCKDNVEINNKYVWDQVVKLVKDVKPPKGFVSSEDLAHQLGLTHSTIVNWPGL